MTRHRNAYAIARTSHNPTIRRTPDADDPAENRRTCRAADVAITAKVTIREIGPSAETLLPEVFAWLGQRGIAPAGAPFFKYNVIDMERQLEIAFGVPTSQLVAGDGRVHAGRCRPGRYASLVHRGPDDDLYDANASLIGWAKRAGPSASTPRRPMPATSSAAGWKSIAPIRARSPIRRTLKPRSRSVWQMRTDLPPSSGGRPPLTPGRRALSGRTRAEEMELCDVVEPRMRWQRLRSRISPPRRASTRQARSEAGRAAKTRK